MKKSLSSLKLGITTAILTLFISCSGKPQIKNPTDIGQEAFLIVEQIPELTAEAYAEKLISFETLQTFKTLSPEGFTNFLAEVTAEDIEKDGKRDFDDFQMLVKNDSTHWKDLSFVDFTYSLDSIDGLQFVDGRLKVSNGYAEYNIRTSSIFNGESYILAGLKPLNN